MSNVPTVDLLAIDRDDYSRQVAIQVKTNDTNKKNEWLLSIKDEKRSESNFFYVFVKFSNDSMAQPEYFVVPSKMVSEYIHKRHYDWLATPGKNGQPHKDQSMRMFADYESIYKDNWSLLRK